MRVTVNKNSMNCSTSIISKLFQFTIWIFMELDILFRLYYVKFIWIIRQSFQTGKNQFHWNKFYFYRNFALFCQRQNHMTKYVLDFNGIDNVSWTEPRLWFMNFFDDAGLFQLKSNNNEWFSRFLPIDCSSTLISIEFKHYFF